MTNVTQPGYRWWAWVRTVTITDFTLMVDDYSGGGKPDKVYYIVIGY